MVLTLPIPVSIVLVCLLGWVGLKMINYLFPDQLPEKKK
jgi:hypothetical protein